MTRLLIGLIFVGCFSPRGFAKSFSDNVEWGKIRTAVYSATIYKNGTMNVDVKDSLQFYVCFLQRWNQPQKFPYIKLMDAKLQKDRNNGCVSFLFYYYWNEGEVFENITFKSSSIRTSYTYIPFSDKNISRLACVFKIQSPPSPESIKLSGMMRHLESDGALIEFNKWEHSAKGLRMLSVKTPGPRSVCFIAEKNAWLQLWHWPRLGLINNGSYPNWDRSTRKKGEKYEIKHFISITNNDATVPEKSSVRFTTTNN